MMIHVTNRATSTTTPENKNWNFSFLETMVIVSAEIRQLSIKETAERGASAAGRQLDYGQVVDERHADSGPLQAIIGPALQHKLLLRLRHDNGPQGTPPALLSHDGSFSGLLGNDFTERRVRVLFPLLKCSLVYQRLQFIRKIRVGCRPLILEFLILRVTVGTIALCFP
jgi:hypothetical protein